MRRSNNRRGWIGRMAALALLALLCVASPSASQADLCSDCREPTEAELARSKGFELETRYGPLDSEGEDYVVLEGGPCKVELVGKATIEKTNEWLVVRASGCAWTCPHSTSTGTFTARTIESDSSEWSLSTTLGVSGTVLGAGLTAQVTAAVKQSHAMTEVTEVTQHIRANWCRIIPWTAMFHVADFQAEAKVKVKRTWKWWTGNPVTKYEVHRVGSCEISCGTADVVLTRKAPLSGYFHLCQRACRDPGCAHIVATDLGFMPQLPPGLEPPIGWHPPIGDEPDEEPAAGPDGGDTPPAGQ